MLLTGLAGNVLVGGLGVAYALGRDGGPLGLLRGLPLGLDTEGTLPALWSALLLLAAAGATARLGRGVRRWSALGVAGLFAVMALDELLALHERLEVLVRVDWLVLYAPVIVLGAVGWCRVLLRLLPVRPAALAWVGGAACWATAQALEFVQYDGPMLVHRWTILPEELLEMSGSLLFLVAALRTVQHLGTIDQAASHR